MESVRSNIRTSEFKIYRKVTKSILSGLSKGKLTITYPDGEEVTVGDGHGFSADLKILCEDFFRKIVMYGDVGFGEAYCDGDWTTSDLTTLIRFMIDNLENSGFMSGSKVKRIGMNLLGLFNKAKHKINKNSLTGSKENISYHYDLSNNFYELMLDRTMSYSCGIFYHPDTTLEQAQLNKLDKICERLDIQPGDHILEIGCGWGGLALHILNKYDCRFTCITISQEQYSFFNQRLESLGLQEKVDLKMMDYRNLEGQFDKIVSIEMIEAVGHEFLPEYFRTINRLLKKDGVALVQAITSPDSRYEEFRNGVDFIQKHIFPGSLCPSVGAMIGAFQHHTDLQLRHLDDIGDSYGPTLRFWQDNVKKNKTAIENLGMDEIFFRKWEFYLCYCEAAFLERNISDVQMTLIKPNNTSYEYPHKRH